MSRVGKPYSVKGNCNHVTQQMNESSWKQRLHHSRAAFTRGLGDLLLGPRIINKELFEDLETRLLLADVGVQTSSEIISKLTDRVQRQSLNDPQALRQALREELLSILTTHHRPFCFPDAADTSLPQVILMVGANGSGKTTTLGKLAHYFKAAGRHPLLAAGDTFRAAAIEQLQHWGQANDVQVVAQQEGADSAAVIFDALSAAQARGADLVLADTAGRLHSQTGLMDELTKIQRVVKKFHTDLPLTVLLVLDGNSGQNAVQQAQEFARAVDVSGLVLSKLDGSARGGVVFAIMRQTALPVQFIGVGEGVEHLLAFDPEKFVAALLDD